MKTLAAILVETGKPLVIEDIEIPALKPGQVLVKIAYSGICHTQVLECRGYRGEDKYLPHCLGHEGSGMVHEVGEGVTKVKKGDRVILSWIKGSGADVPGTVYDWNGKKVNSGAITTFSKYSIISENRLTPIKDDFPMREAALIGCVVPTGVGSVLNVAKPEVKNNIAVFGVGGVGLCAVAASSIAGCEKIIAVDVLDNKLAVARQMGATDLVNSANADPVAEILKLSPGGVDRSVEASGRPAAMRSAFYCVRSRGGRAVIAGNARKGEMLEIDPSQLNQGKSLLGTWGGDSKPDSDYPYYCELVTSGKLKLGPLMSKPYSLKEINRAIDDLEAGKAIRPLVDMSL